MSYIRHLFTGFLAVILTASFLPLLADEGDEAIEVSELKIEEIIVTARKQSETLQDVP